MPADFDAAIFGLIVADLLASPMDLRNPPQPGGLHLVDSITLATGGNAPNVAVAMARLGMKVAVSGLVGKDVLGEAIRQRLAAEGLDTSTVLTTDQAQTSATVVAIEPGGERCFFHTAGATALLDADAFRRCIPLLARCAYVQIGYFGLLPALTPHLGQVIGELKRAAPNVKVALDTVNPPAAADLLWPVLPHLDVFAPSRPEARMLTGETDPAMMVQAFRRHMPTGLIGIKLDAEGCLLDDGRGQVRVPACPIRVADTTGAGDSWFGGLLTALRKGMGLEEAGRFANRVADLLIDKPKGLYLSSFRCMSRLVIDGVTRYEGPFPYVDGLIMQVTQRIGTLEVRHLPRAQGRSNYTLRRLVRLWLNLAFNFSLLPLRLAVFLGLAMGAIGGIGALYVIAHALFGQPPEGWASTMVVVLLLSAAQFVILGIVGEYLGRTFQTGNRKPQGIVRAVVRATVPDHAR